MRVDIDKLIELWLAEDHPGILWVHGYTRPLSVTDYRTKGIRNVTLQTSNRTSIQISVINDGTVIKFEIGCNNLPPIVGYCLEDEDKDIRNRRYRSTDIYSHLKCFKIEEAFTINQLCDA